MSRRHTVSRFNRHHIRIGIVVRCGLSEYVADDDDGFPGRVWKARGNVRDFANLASADFDVGWTDRSRCSAGWKNQKHRRQWEHKALREFKRICKIKKG